MLLLHCRNHEQFFEKLSLVLGCSSKLGMLLCTKRFCTVFVVGFYRILIISDAKTIETLKMDDFLQKLKRWSVSYYTDRLLTNQIAGKPVRISYQ